MELLKERKKTFHCNLAYVTKELAGVEVGNESLRWFCGNVNDKVVALEKEMGSTLKTVAESA